MQRIAGTMLVGWIALECAFSFAAGDDEGKKKLGADPVSPKTWIDAMTKVRAKFSGESGTLALFGDSITVSLAFWTPLADSPRGLPKELTRDLELVNQRMKSECWRDWRGPEFGNEGGMTIRWAQENVDRWLAKLNPELAVILFGTNDLGDVPLDEYRAKLRDVVGRCIAHGTVVILTTPPPRHGFVERAEQFARAVRDVAGELQVPLIDYHAEILRRRPDDWDGASAKFRHVAGDVYDVPTLVSRDGVHPSNPKDHQDFAEESLDRNGYLLRSALTLSAYARVIRNSLVPGDRLRRIRSKRIPTITEPVMFDTPEADAILAALEILPPDNAFHRVVSDWPLHPNSERIMESIGPEKPFRYNRDMGFVIVPPDQPRVEVKVLDYASESDPGPYPVPDSIPIEGWPVSFQRDAAKPLTLAEVQKRPPRYEADRHAIIVDPVNRKLWEFFTFGRSDDGSWAADQASIFDLGTNNLRPDGWTSADAAGLPIFPAVVRYDEIERGFIDHALRVTVRRTRRAYVHPATHFASRREEENLPRMGERLRLRADFDTAGFSAPVCVILEALKRYGMLVADNGIDWAISVTPDPRIPVLHEELRKIRGADFEVVVAPED